MKVIRCRRLVLTGFVVTQIMLVILLTGSSAVAQHRGQYVPGTTGLDSATQPQPGLSYTNIFIFSGGGQLVDAGGNDVAGFSTSNLAVDQNIFTYTTAWKIFGGNYGAKLDVPVADGPITMSRLREQSISLALADIYVEPFSLGWHTPGADVRVAYGFVAPTGAQRVTSDFWGHDVTLASTVYLNERKTYSASLNAVLELHQKKRHQDTRVGNNLNVEYGVGHAMSLGKESKTVLHMGVVGYLEWQLAKDTGQNVPLRTDNPRDQVFAVGPELNLSVSQWRTNILFRYAKEVYVLNRGQGQTFAVSVSKAF